MNLNETALMILMGFCLIEYLIGTIISLTTNCEERHLGLKLVMVFLVVVALVKLGGLI